MVATDAALDDNFGIEIDIEGDIAVVGVDEDDDDGNRSGSAYIFLKSGTFWLQHEKLTASDASSGDHFGRSVSISGQTVAVGANYASPGGAVYVFVGGGSVWSEQAKLTGMAARLL